jgi:integrase
MSQTRRVAFTDRTLKALKPPKERGQPVYDAVVPGLCVRVGARAPVFYVTKRVGTQFKWIRLGAYPIMTLAEARGRAREVLSAISEGKPLPAPAKTVASFAEIAEEFIETVLPTTRKGQPKRTVKAEERAFRAEILPVLGQKDIRQITPKDIAQCLEGIANRTRRTEDGRLVSGGPHAARKILPALNRLFEWAAYPTRQKGGLQTNPMSAIVASEMLTGLAFSTVRDRVLDDAELRIIWRAACATPRPFGDLVRALLLTGQRLGEIANAQQSEIEEGTGCLLIPAERMKNRESHAVPLTERMRELLYGLPRFTTGDFIFTATYGVKPISGFSKYKRRFDQTVAAIGPVAPWRLHDLRRTARTGLSRAGVLPFHAELVIGHRQAGVHATYDLHRYAAEKLDALERWEKLLESIVDPSSALALAAAS